MPASEGVESTEKLSETVSIAVGNTAHLVPS